MLVAALSASRRGFLLLTVVLSFAILSLGLSGCAGVVSPSTSQTSTPSPTGLAISNVQVSSATASSVQLSWATNQPATSAIHYGTTSAYGISTAVNSSMVTNHQMGLTGLKSGTTYHYSVLSAADGTTAASSDQTFSTPSAADTTPPTITITSPAAGATISGNVNLTATAVDSVGVASVQFRVDGASVGASLTAAPFAYTLNSAALSNGSHTLSAIATDTAGNSATSANVTVTVNNTTKDTTPPAVTITAPASGAKVSGAVLVTANATDNVSVASVQFQVDGANVGAAALASPYLYSWDTTKTSNGTHVLSAVAKDGAGNSTTSAMVTVTVNNLTPPAPTQTFTISGTLSPATGGAGATVTLSGTSAATTTANGSGVYIFSALAAGLIR